PTPSPLHAMGSISYAWPERIKWAVEVYEALLGTAWKYQSGSAAEFFRAPIVPRDQSGRADDLVSASRSNVYRAQLCLVCEWLACRASIEYDPAVRTLLLRLAGLESAAR